MDRYPYDYAHHYPDTTFDAVKHLNEDLQILGPVFRAIKWDTATSVTPDHPFNGLKYITAIEDGGTGNPDSLYCELALYYDNDSVDYFLIVNRRCLPTDTVMLSVRIGGEYTEKVWLVDQLTKEIIECETGTGNVLIRIAPGDGRLFKIAEIPPWNSNFARMTALNNGRRLLSVPRRDGWTDLAGYLYVHELYSDGDSVYYTTKHPWLYYWTDPKAIGAGIYPALVTGRGNTLTLDWQMAACWVSCDSESLWYAYKTGQSWAQPTKIHSTSSAYAISSPSMVIGRNYEGTSDSVHICYGLYYPTDRHYEIH